MHTFGTASQRFPWPRTLAVARNRRVHPHRTVGRHIHAGMGRRLRRHVHPAVRRSRAPPRHWRRCTVPRRPHRQEHAHQHHAHPRQRAAARQHGGYGLAGNPQGSLYDRHTHTQRSVRLSRLLGPKTAEKTTFGRAPRAPRAPFPPHMRPGSLPLFSPTPSHRFPAGGRARGGARARFVAIFSIACLHLKKCPLDSGR